MAGESSHQVLLLHAKHLRGLRGRNRSLDDLPEEILLHILSFLSPVDAVATSLISRKWRPLWSLVPSLNFSYDLFPVAARYNRKKTKLRIFVDFIDRALILRPDSPIQTFRLSFIFKNRLNIHIDSWIRCAVRRLKARHLHIDNFINDSYGSGDCSQYHAFDFSLLRGGCVEVLRLRKCFFTLPKSISIMKLRSLRSIYLERIHLKDQMVEDLILGCPNLEDLELRSCMLKILNICSGSIKKLALVYDCDSEFKESIEIDCPNLCSLRFSNCNFSKFVLHEAPALVEFRVDFACFTNEYFDLWIKIVRLLEQAPHVKKLYVQNWWYNYKLLITKQLNNINHLELRTGYTRYEMVGMAALIELCPNLQTMVLDYVEKMKENEKCLPEEFSNEPVDFNMPKLKKVTMIAYTGTQAQVNFVTVLKTQGVKVELVSVNI